MRKWPRSLTILLLALAAILVSVLKDPLNTAVTKSFDQHNLNTPAGYLGVTLLIILAAIAIYFLQRQLTRHDTPESYTPPLQARQALIHQVTQFAQAQFDGGLYHLARQEFQLAERPLHVTTRDNDTPINDGGIEPFYRRLDGPLLILGEPGTGKTTLLYELTTLLLPQPGDDHQPIPVPFEISAWATRQLPLDEWLAAELNRRHGVSSSLAKRWIDSATILPLLDGLDEVPAAHRPACVTRINEFRRQHPGLKLVLTCRESEYAALAVGLDAHSAVIVRPLAPAAVESYLARHANFAGLRHALNTAPELWEIMTTPLMLWVAAFAFLEDPGQPLPPVPPAALRAILFDRYIHRMVQRESVKRDPSGPTFSVEETDRWLRGTAAAMVRAGVTSFQLEELSLLWLPDAQRPAARWRLRMLAGLIFGLIFGLSVGLTYGLSVGLIFGLIFGLSVGLTYGLIVVLSGGQEAPVDAVRWSWSEARGGLIFGQIFGRRIDRSR